MLVPSGKNLVILNGSCGRGKEKKKERKIAYFNFVLFNYVLFAKGSFANTFTYHSQRVKSVL
jgi:hypothetical protein